MSAEIEARLDALTRQVELLVEANRRQSELIEEMTPIARAAMDAGIVTMGELEARGWFRFGRGSMAILERVVESTSEEDLQALGDAIVGIVDTVKAVTQPEVLQIVSEAAETVQEGGGDPLTMMGLVKASRDEEVQAGLAVAVELLKQLGKASDQVGRTRRKRGLDRLAPKRTRRAPRKAAGEQAPRTPKATPPPKPAEDFVIDGVALDESGFLADPQDWNEEIAARMATACGVAELTDAHWAVLRFARAEFLESGKSPNIRKITTGSGVSTKELYALFPRAPGKSTARCAGIPKPAGCI